MPMVALPPPATRSARTTRLRPPTPVDLRIQPAHVRRPCRTTWRAGIEDFDVHFTLVAPGDDVPHDTIIVTSNGDWCGYVPAGLAPVTCDPIEGGTAWAFSCGDSAEQCAAIIAQEHAHLLGLEHTRSTSDLMSNPLCTACAGFEDRDNRVIGGRCRTLQNSYALMKQRLGPRGPVGSTHR